ncbi:hypothetical protein PESP_a2435 [Pseudoalteromonas espejiana DSM 9414]|nr:hypothetical protein PESP_a2435 [Pseudoalteromonas espejiana DSM 9414]
MLFLVALSIKHAMKLHISALKVCISLTGNIYMKGKIGWLK